MNSYLLVPSNSEPADKVVITMTMDEYKIYNEVLEFAETWMPLLTELGETLERLEAECGAVASGEMKDAKSMYQQKTI